ncbi:MAG: four helix bundle protein [Candidatus Omnitrophota bacterium]
MQNKIFEFDFERLDVYQKSLEFSDKIFRLTQKFSFYTQFSLGDQFRRAGLSICNNIAEGSRKEGKSKKQFYGYALDSCRECIPMISIAGLQGQITQDEKNQLRFSCESISRMLFRLIQSVI